MTKGSHPTHRIGIDARFYRRSTGGIGTYTRNLLATMLARDTHNQYFIFVTPDDLVEWDIHQPNVTVLVTSTSHYSLKEQTSFLRELYRHKLDLVHFLNFNHPLLYRKPFIITIHDLTLFLFPANATKTSAVKRVGFHAVFRRGVRKAAKVIAVSENTAKDLEEILSVSQAQIEVVHEGAPQSVQFLPGGKDTVQKYIGTRDPYFFFLSQWRPHKGVLTLIEAFDRFKEHTGLPHKLVLCGSQKAATQAVRDALVNAKFASDIIAPGFAPDELLPLLYHFAVAHVLPSEYEGVGLSALDAFTYGTPVIAANNSSLPYVVGKAGLLFPTRDAEALASCMVELAQNPETRDKLIQRGSVQVKQFSWDTAADHTLSIYRAVLEKRR